jgi:hypothetical protein
MSRYPAPVYIGRFDPVRAGDIIDLYIDIQAELADGETIDSVAFAVADAGGRQVAGVVTAHSESDARTDFRLSAPASAGLYTLTAVFTISDGQKLTRAADLRVV